MGHVSGAFVRVCRTRKIQKPRRVSGWTNECFVLQGPSESLLGSPVASAPSPRQVHADNLRRISVPPPSRLMQARVAAAAPDLIDVSVRCARHGKLTCVHPWKILAHVMHAHTRARKTSVVGIHSANDAFLRSSVDSASRHVCETLTL